MTGITLGVLMVWPIRRWAIVLAALSAAGCAHTTTGPGFVDAVAALDPASFTCCADPEKFYPSGVINTAFALAEVFGPGVAQGIYGRYQENGYPGKMAGNVEAEAAMLARLQPLDIVVSGNKSYLWGHIIPGRFSHNLIYLGNEAQLRAAGFWGLPALAPLRDDIRAGRLFVEAVTPAVQIVGADRVVQADTLAILRPELGTAARARAYDALAGSIGVPYDYTFDIASTDRLACTELIPLAMPGLRVAPRVAYGQAVIFPDAVAAQAIRGERLALVGYMVGTDDGFAWRSVHSLMADIAAHWGVPGTDP